MSFRSKLIFSIAFALLTLGALVYGNKKQVSVPFKVVADEIHFTWPFYAEPASWYFTLEKPISNLALEISCGSYHLKKNYSSSELENYKNLIIVSKSFYPGPCKITGLTSKIADLRIEYRQSTTNFLIKGIADGNLKLWFLAFCLALFFCCGLIYIWKPKLIFVVVPIVLAALCVWIVVPPLAGHDDTYHLLCWAQASSDLSDFEIRDGVRALLKSSHYFDINRIDNQQRVYFENSTEDWCPTKINSQYDFQSTTCGCKVPPLYAVLGGITKSFAVNEVSKIEVWGKIWNQGFLWLLTLALGLLINKKKDEKIQSIALIFAVPFFHLTFFEGTMGVGLDYFTLFLGGIITFGFWDFSRKPNTGSALGLTIAVLISYILGLMWLPMNLEKKSLVFIQILPLLIFIFFEIFGKSNWARKFTLTFVLIAICMFTIEVYTKFPWGAVKAAAQNFYQNILQSGSGRSLENYLGWLAESLAGSLVSEKYSAPTIVQFVSLFGYVMVTYLGWREICDRLPKGHLSTAFKINVILMLLLILVSPLILGITFDEQSWTALRFTYPFWGTLLLLWALATIRMPQFVFPTILLFRIISLCTLQIPAYWMAIGIYP